MKQIIIAVFAIPILAGFKNKHKEEPVPLFETKWYLTNMQLTDGQYVITLKKAFIQFNEEKKTARGNGSCNSFGGELRVDKDSLQVNNIFSTKMYCESVQQTENSFFELLRKANRFKIRGKKLLLYSGEMLLLDFTAD